MTEQDNTAFVKKMFDAFNRGDLQTILDNLAPDVEFISEGPSSIPYAGKYRGVDEVRRFFQALATTEENQNLVRDSFIAQGESVAVTGRFAATVKATGKRFDTALAHVFTIRGAKVARFLDFYDTSAVAEAHESSGAAARR